MSSEYKAIVLGTSAGGMDIIKKIIPALPEKFTIPFLIVQHISDASDGIWTEILNKQCKVIVKEADEKEQIAAGKVYLAPANYHLLLEEDLSLTLTVDEKVNYARPSIDVLFETAAEACKNKLIGIVCTGGNTDGAKGLKRIKNNGGLTIVQDPATADVKSMPQAAIQEADPDYILPPEEILSLLLEIHKEQPNYAQ